MLLSAVFFDLVGTLARFVPEQEELLVQAAGAHGLDLSLDQARRGFASAGEWWNRVVGPRYRTASPAQREALNLEYDRRLFEGAGVSAPDGSLSSVFRELLRRGGPSRLALYGDVLPVLEHLRERGFRLGVVSNMSRELPSVLQELGIRDFLDVVVSSGEVGVTKPDRQIFMEAARRAGLPIGHILYVGDLYETDVIGARDAGMDAMLLDRHGIFSAPAGCLVSRTLEDLLRLPGPR